MYFSPKQRKIIEANEPKILCLSSAASGKALPNSTKIPTTDGWKEVGDIRPGDYLYDRCGKPTKVLNIFPQGKLEVFLITFGDGRTAKCSKDHIWSYYKIPNGKRLYSKTLEEILLENSGKLNKYKNKAGKYCYQIPLIEKVKYPKREYPIPPYILGLFLGDGSFREETIMFSSKDDFLPKKIATIMDWDYYRHKTNKYCWYFKHKKAQKNGNYEFYRVKTSEFLKAYPELINKKSEEKFIPEDYLIGSVEQRIELLRGLLDTDGCIGERGNIRYTTVSEKLCKSILSLVYSLGFKGGYYIEDKGENRNKAYHISIQCSNQEKSKLFSVPEKYQRAIKVSNKKNSHYSNTNPIVDIKSLNYEEEMTCFYVDNEEHLFAINDWCITHNTRVLTERIRYLITECNVNESDIVAITFTNMAAEEMKTRLKDCCKNMFIGTIHSYANKICYLNGVSTSEDIQTADFDKILKKVIRINPKRYPKIKYLLIDECQDLGNLEHIFIRKIPTENIFYCGDFKQMIYSFRGVSGDYVKDLYYDTDFKKYSLIDNYRNPPNIINFANSFIDRYQEQFSPSSSPVKTQDGIIEECSFYDALDELEESEEWGSWFILTRTNNELYKAQEILDKRDIPNLTFKTGDLTLSQLKAFMGANKVKILTIHTSKGLSLKNVIVVGARTYNDEERRICYVAATRAENALYWCPSIAGRRGSVNKKNRDFTKEEGVINF